MAPRGKTARTTGGRKSPIDSARDMLDKQINKAATKAKALRDQATALDASVEPLKASREALGDRDTGGNAGSAAAGKPAA